MSRLPEHIFEYILYHGVFPIHMLSYFVYRHQTHSDIKGLISRPVCSNNCAMCLYIPTLNTTSLVNATQFRNWEYCKKLFKTLSIIVPLQEVELYSCLHPCVHACARARISEIINSKKLRNMIRYLLWLRPVILDFWSDPRWPTFGRFSIFLINAKS